MCLDIDPSSVIHKHLNKKIYNTVYEGYEYLGDGQCDYYRHSRIIGESYGKQINNRSHKDHNLTMLPSFHISLGAPKKEIKVDAINNKFCHMGIVPIVGDITLAPICISEKDNKKSAWIPLHPCWLDQILLTNELNLDQFDSFDHRCDECPVQHLHVSVANLTGNPHDSIARPEDCIIDTIRA
jgi:hypothetical protein